MSSDRLKELQRQRALAQEQVAWFDREIARETGELPAVAALLESKAPASNPTPVVPPVAQSAADILSQYSKETPGSMAKDAKRGCLLYFAFAMGVLFLSAIAAYFIWQQSR
jgi:hypothetical protein